MGFSLWKWLRGLNGTPRGGKIACAELAEAAQEYSVRNLCFWSCVNLVANAMGRCEARTFRGGTEIFEKEYYLWNVEPNVNQSSTAFWHKLVAQLYTQNEALVISTRRRDGHEALVVADAFVTETQYPARQNEYTGVVVESVQYEKTFRESEVLHLTLNREDMRPVMDALAASYQKLIGAAMRAYAWNRGHHWKVHVSQMAQGGDQWEQHFQGLLNEQLKPFVRSESSVLPEFDGYAYEDVGGKRTGETTRDLRAMIDDVMEFTARGFLIPPVLMSGKVEGTQDANSRFLTNCIDPLCDQIGEEIVRKRYGYEAWQRGDRLVLDSSTIVHFDLFEAAVAVEKLVGSGAYTINDVRRAAGQPLIREPWADRHYLTLNISPMDQTARAMEKGAKTP